MADRIPPCTRIEGSFLVPDYLTPVDYPWLSSLIDERERFEGRRVREWKTRMEEPLSFSAPSAKLAVAAAALERLAPVVLPVGVPSAQVREVVFRAAAVERQPEAALQRAASTLELPAEALRELLFADLPPERLLGLPRPRPSPEILAHAANAALVTSLMKRATLVRVEARGDLRAFLRQVRLSGLVCVVDAQLSRGMLHEVRIELSGPLSLFRHTTLYGRTLARLLPRLTWCNEFRLEADCLCTPGQSLATLVLSRGDPISTALELPPFDSPVEDRFARDFRRVALDWEIIREPTPVTLGPGPLVSGHRGEASVGSGVVFPDFELRHRREPGRCWFVEIVGFWTPEYLRGKLRKLTAAGLDQLILCIDEERNCAEELLSPNAAIVPFRRKIDPRKILAILESAGLPQGRPHRGAPHRVGGPG